jgi:hypothetical protein
MYCECGRKSENVLTGGPCATCKSNARKAARKAATPRKIYRLPKPTTRIRKVSKAQAAANAIYSAEKKGFIHGQPCAVFPEQKATQIHHRMGRSRSGFADEWAKSRGIAILWDRRYWLAVSDDGHEKITKESEWAYKMGFSVKRLKKV